MSTFTPIPSTAFEEAFDQALEYLQRLLRINTSNPPGNEREACDYIGRILQGEGIPFEIIESAPGRANLVCRLHGDGSHLPVLLNAHLDVVPAEREFWTHDPFGGEIDKGFVWGRGALDMKHMAIMSLMTIILLHRHKISLKRDLIFAAVADEEAGGNYGSGWLVDHHPEKIRAEYALGEIGGLSRSINGKNIYLVQTAEKGICWLRIKAKGESGHGSLPSWNNAVSKIGKAAHRLGSVGLPFHLTPETESFVRTLAEHQPFPNGWILRKVLNPRWSRLILDRIVPDQAMARSLYAGLHNTANPTVVRGGDKVNVLPSEATLEVDGRTLPGQTPEDFVREVRTVIGDDYEVEITQCMAAVSTSPTDPILGNMAEALNRYDPLAVVVPFMAPGFTDAKHYSRLGTRCYGFSPVKLPDDFDFTELIHGHDERIPVEGFRFGLQVLCDLVTMLCT